MNEEIKNKVNLRKLGLSDAKRLADFFNNRKIWDNLRNSIPFPYTENDAINFIEFVRKDKLQEVFAIDYKDEFCGIVGLTLQQDVYEKSAEIGYWIGEPFWGKGIATKSVEQITKYGFSNLKLIRIYSGVFEYNVASMKVLEKNGYSKDGIFKKAIFKNGKICDEYRYSKLNLY